MNKKIDFKTPLMAIFCLLIALPLTAEIPFAGTFKGLSEKLSGAKYLKLELWQWLGIAAAVGAGFLIKIIVHHIMALVFKLVSSKTETEWDDKIVAAVRGPIGYVAATGFWYLCLRLLQFQDPLLTGLSKLLNVLMGIFLIWMGHKLVCVFMDFLQVITSKTESTLDDQLLPVASKTLKVLVVGLGAMIIIQNLGINVLSLVAGLGVGGLAFALAAKDTAANLFGSLTIFSARPFLMGDWIRIGDTEGIVEEIGLRSTRIRTFEKTLIIIPNATVANSTIINVSARQQWRRTYVTLGLTYDTPVEKIEAFLEGSKNILLASPQTDKENMHVAFTGYGASSLNVMLYFFLDSPGYADELMGRQKIYLQIKKLAEELKIAFAFPTQTLHLESMPGKRPAAPPKAAPMSLAAGAQKFAAGKSLSKPDGYGIYHPPYQAAGDDE